MPYDCNLLNKIDKASPSLQKRFESENVLLYHSDKINRLQKFVKEGYIPKDLFFTVNRPNNFHDDGYIVIEVSSERAKEILREDPCEEQGKVVTSEYCMHDQVYACDDLDYTNDSDVKFKELVIKKH